MCVKKKLSPQVQMYDQWSLITELMIYVGELNWTLFINKMKNTLCQGYKWIKCDNT